MKGKLMFISVCVIVLLITSGCWNRRELNELGIVVGIGIDKTENGYRVTYQFVNPGEVAQQKGGGQRTAVSSYTTEALTIQETSRKVTTAYPRKPYVSHLRVLVIGEEVAREGISPILDFISRDHEFRTDFYILVAKGHQAKDTLEILMPVEQIPAQNLFTKLEDSEKNWAPTHAVTLDELISTLVSKGKEPVLTGLELKGSPEMGNKRDNIQMVDSPTKLIYTGLGLFKGDKLQAWMNQDESRGFNWLTDHINSSVVSLPCDQGHVSIETIRATTKVKGKVRQGKPEILVDIFAESNVGEVACQGLDLTKTQTIYDLEKKVEKDLRAILEASIKKAKTYKADVFGFGEAIHRADPKAWKELEKNWDEEFKDLAVRFQIDVKIRRTGTTSTSFLEEMKKEK